MKRRIQSMTQGQTRRVCDVVLPLTRAWLLARGARDGRYGGCGAFADLERQVYVGIVQVEFTADGLPVKADLLWRLDADFGVVGEPELRVKDSRAAR